MYSWNSSYRRQQPYGTAIRDDFSDIWGTPDRGVDIPSLPTGSGMGTVSPIAQPSTPAPPQTFLDRLASRMGDFGYHVNEGDKKAALQRAINTLGMAMLQKSTTEGLSGLPSAIAAGFGSYQGAVRDIDQAHQDEAKFDLYKQNMQRQDRLTDAQIDNLEADNQQRRDEMQVKIQQRKDLVAARRAAISKLSPEIQAKLEPVIGEDSFGTVYEKLTGEKLLKPEDTIHNVGRDMMQLDPKTGEWKLVHRAPSDSNGGANSTPWAGIDYVTRGDQMVRVNKATGEITPVYQFSGTGADPEAARRAIAKDATTEQIKNWSGDTPPDYWKLFTKNYEQAGAFAGAKKGGVIDPGTGKPGALGSNKIQVDPAEAKDVSSMVKSVGLDKAKRILAANGKTPGQIAALLKAAGF